MTWVGALVAIGVAIFTFVAGTRAGKNAADRQALRDIYKQLFEHFDGLVKAIDRGEPKRWSSFELVERREYMPVAKRLDRTGPLHMLPSRLAARLVAAEESTLNAAGRFHRQVDELLTLDFERLCQRAISPPAIIDRSIHISLVELAANPARIAGLDNHALTVDVPARPGSPGYGGRTSRVVTKPMADSLGGIEKFRLEFDGLLQKSGCDRAWSEVEAARRDCSKICDELKLRLRDPNPFPELLRDLGGDLSSLWGSRA